MRFPVSGAIMAVLVSLLVLLVAIPVTGTVVSNIPLPNGRVAVGVAGNDFHQYHVFITCQNYTVGSSVTYGSWELIPSLPSGC